MWREQYLVWVTRYSKAFGRFLFSKGFQRILFHIPAIQTSPIILISVASTRWSVTTAVPLAVLMRKKGFLKRNQITIDHFVGEFVVRSVDAQNICSFLNFSQTRLTAIFISNAFFDIVTQYLHIETA